MTFITICVALMFSNAMPTDKDYNCTVVSADMGNGMVDACLHDPVIDCAVTRGRPLKGGKPAPWVVTMWRLESQAEAPAKTVPVKPIGSNL